MKKIKPSKNSLEKFTYFSQCMDSLRLPKIELEPDGYSAAECFHVYETYGELYPCREPELLSRALNGKASHGVTVTMCAEDFIGRILFSSEINANYPSWVADEIYSRARQICKERLGFVPTFVETGKDFTLLFSI